MLNCDHYWDDDDWWSFNDLRSTSMLKPRKTILRLVLGIVAGLASSYLGVLPLGVGLYLGLAMLSGVLLTSQVGTKFKTREVVVSGFAIALVIVLIWPIRGWQSSSAFFSWLIVKVLAISLLVKLNLSVDSEKPFIRL